MAEAHLQRGALGTNSKRPPFKIDRVRNCAFYHFEKGCILEGQHDASFGQEVTLRFTEGRYVYEARLRLTSVEDSLSLVVSCGDATFGGFVHSDEAGKVNIAAIVSAAAILLLSFVFKYGAMLQSVSGDVV